MDKNQTTVAVTAFMFAALGGILIMKSGPSLVPSGAVGSPTAEPEIMELTGTVRDFRERTDPGGHPDFEVKPDAGYGHYAGNIGKQLDSDGKPAFVGGGRKVTTQATNASNQPIAPHMANSEYVLVGSVPGLVNHAWGDTPAVLGVVDNGGITSADSFAQWYRDVPGTNLSMPLTLKLVKQADGSFVFDDKTDPLYENLGGFFPIEKTLLGNPGGSPDRNFHFTFELSAEFQYDADANQIFRYDGDDDVFVFVDGKLALDIGGVHGSVSQYVDFKRMGLTDGETYSLHFFFAERHRTQSNFRLVTNIPLVTNVVPMPTASYD